MSHNGKPGRAKCVGRERKKHDGIVHEKEGTRNHLILLAMEDITVRRELEWQKETFLGMVSHELKTPLTSAKGFIQILQRHVQNLSSVPSFDNISSLHPAPKRFER
jgi:signal transduction histidine kinase